MIAAWAIMAASVAILMANNAEMRIKPLFATKSRTTRDPLHASMTTDAAATAHDSGYCFNSAFILSRVKFYTLLGCVSRLIGGYFYWFLFLTLPSFLNFVNIDVFGLSLSSSINIFSAIGAAVKLSCAPTGLIGRLESVVLK